MTFDRFPAQATSRRRCARARRGVASVLAMLYLLIFASLAVGFYAAVTTAAQVAHNDERALRAQVAAESGLLFVQYELSRVSMPGNTPHDKVMDEVFADLRTQQARSDNLAGRAIGFTPGVAGTTPDIIEFPADPDDFIPLDFEGAGFRATLTDLGHGDLRLKIVGRHRGVIIERAVQMNFRSVYKDLSIFDYGIVTRGNFDMSGSGRITGVDPSHAHVLSTSRQSVPITLSGNVAIDGDAHMVNPDGGVDMTGRASIGGSRQSDGGHIHRGVPEPEFPSIDTSVFLPYATNPYVAGQSLYRNVLVPPNTNPTFNNKVTIEGVLYIRHPNVVTFSGQSTIRGSIVVENGAVPGPNNAMKFSGGATTYGMETLPESPYFPPGLRALSGSTLLAPGFEVTMSGHSGAFGGTMVADLFSFTGTSDRAVEGSLIALGNGPFRIRGNATIHRTRPPIDQIPAGLNFTRTLKPLHDTYLEVRP